MNEITREQQMEAKSKRIGQIKSINNKDNRKRIHFNEYRSSTHGTDSRLLPFAISNNRKNMSDNKCAQMERN